MSLPTKGVAPLSYQILIGGLNNPPTHHVIGAN